MFTALLEGEPAEPVRSAEREHRKEERMMAAVRKKYAQEIDAYYAAHEADEKMEL